MAQVHPEVRHPRSLAPIIVLSGASSSRLALLEIMVWKYPAHTQNHLHPNLYPI